jgi:hypothetical protein
MEDLELLIKLCEKYETTPQKLHIKLQETIENDINYNHEYEYISLTDACRYGLSLTAEKMIDNCCNFYEFETMILFDTNKTAFYYACENKMPNIALKIIDEFQFRKAKCHHDYSFNENEIFIIMYNELYDVLEHIAKYLTREQINKYMYNGASILIYAIKNNIDSIIPLLIEKTENIDEDYGDDTFALLITCIYNNQKAALQILDKMTPEQIKQRCHKKLYSQNLDGKAVLSIAKENNLNNVVEKMSIYAEN